MYRTITVMQKYLKPFNCKQMKPLVFDCNTWNHLIECKQRSPGSWKNFLSTNNLFTNYIYIYIYKQDLALNNLQGLVCRKTQPATQRWMGNMKRNPFIHKTDHMFTTIYLDKEIKTLNGRVVILNLFYTRRVENFGSVANNKRNKTTEDLKIRDWPGNVPDWSVTETIWVELKIKEKCLNTSS